MALNDNYRLNISGDSSDLENSLKTIQAYMEVIESMELDAPIDKMGDKLRQIASQAKNLQDIMSKQEGSAFISARDMNEANDSVRKATKEVNDFKQAIKEAQQEQIASGRNPNPELQKTYEKLNRVLDGTKDKIEDLSSVSIGKDASINTRINDMKRLKDLTDDYYKSVEDTVSVNQKLKQVRATRNRVRRNLDKSEISGRMTYDQGIQTQQALNQSGMMRNDAERFKKRMNEFGQFKAESQRQNQDLSRKYSSGTIDKETYEKERAKITASIQAREKEYDALEKLVRELEKTSNYFDNQANQEFSTRKKDARRGTFERIWQERAPSIASHGVMAGMAVGAGAYINGKSLSETNRPMKVALGQQMGNSDYTSIRHDFEDLSIDNHLGYNSTDMLKFASDYMGSVGYKGQENVQEGVKELATGGKAMGISNDEAYRESMNALMHSGALDSGADIKDMQSAFLGGLKDSGMVGKNEEQLKALSTIAESVGQGRTLTKEDLQTTTSMQSLLASSGSKGLQGAQGAQFMSSLNEGFRNGMQDPYTRQALGWGTQYQGLEGRYDLQKRMDKGIADPNNVTDLYQQATLGASTEKGQKMMFNESLKNMGVNATLEQSDELFKMAQEGKLTEKALSDYRKKIEKEGKSERDSNSKDYKESQEGKDDQGKAKASKISEDLYDMAGNLRNANTALMSLPAPLYLAGASAMAFAVSLMKSVAMMKGSQMMNGGWKETGRNIRDRVRGGKKGGKGTPGAPLGGGGKNPKDPKSPKGNGGGSFFDSSTKPSGGTSNGSKGMKGRFFDTFSTLKDKVRTNPDKDTSFKGQFKDITAKTKETGKKLWDFTKQRDFTPKEYMQRTFKGAKGIGKLSGEALEGSVFSKIPKLAQKGNTTKNSSVFSKAKDLFKGNKGTSGIVAGADSLGKFGGLTRGIGKSIPILSTGLSIAGIGTSLASGDKEGVGSSAGSLAGGTIGSTIGATLGSIIPGAGTVAGGAVGGMLGSMGGDFLGREIAKDAKFVKPKSYKDFGLVGKAYHGISNLFSSKDNVGAGKGGGLPDPNSTAPILGGVKGNSGIVSGGEGILDPSKRNLNFLLGANTNGTILHPNDEEEKEDGKKGVKSGLNGVKNETNKKGRMDAERLREKNNDSESKNLKIYKGLLDRAEQLIQDAKSLDLEGGSEGESEGDSGGSASDIGGSGGKKIYKFLKSKGLSDSQVSAVMGNLQQESNLDPNATNPTSGAYGIAQWLGSRKSDLQSFAKSKGKKASDLDAQLDFLWKEMSSGQNSVMLKNAGWSKKGSLESNTKAFATGFERMGANEAMMGTRVSNAKKFKDKYGGGKGGRFSIDPEMSIRNTTPGNLPYRELSDSLVNANSNNMNREEMNSLVSSQIPKLVKSSVTDNNTESNNRPQGTVNNNVNVNVTVEGSENPQETGYEVAQQVKTTLSNDLSIFSNQYRRV